MSGFDRHDSVFSKNFMVLKLLSAAYVIGIIVSHAALPAQHIWWIAAGFSIAMNFTYPWAAVRTGEFFTVEVAVSAALITMAVLGVVFSPLWVIASIFGHGLWDLFKHNGQGVPFLKWYTLGCVSVDWTYAAALLLYFFTSI
ncbi:MAG: hypothetical protein ACPGRD_00955 [Planktomarina sp.]